MEDKFSIFAELHQPKELGPVLAIIPSCKEAKRFVHMMNKQVAAFLHNFLNDAALPEKFLRSLLKETCDAMLVAEMMTGTGIRKHKLSLLHVRKSRTTILRNSRLQPGTRMPLT